MHRFLAQLLVPEGARVPILPLLLLRLHCPQAERDGVFVATVPGLAIEREEGALGATGRRNNIFHALCRGAVLSRFRDLVEQRGQTSFSRFL